MEQKNQTKKLPGFYIALCCCVIAVGVAGFFAQNQPTKPTTASTQVTDTPYEPEPLTEETTLPSSSVETIVIEEPAISESDEYLLPPQTETASYTEDYTVDNPDISPVSVNVNAQESNLFDSPVNNATVLDGFSGDTLVYNEIYKDWRCHSGVDLECEVGTAVCAAADGTVISISNGSYGKEIIIEHSDGFKTIYAQLDNIIVTEGAKVLKGSAIAVVAESTGENITTPHLHFGIKKDNKYVNPEEY